MWLRLLVPLTLIWPVLAIAAEGTSLNRYRATPARELLALLVSVIAFFLLWLALDRALLAVTGSGAAALVAATLVSLVAVPVLLLVGFKLCGVKPGSAGHH